MGDSIYSLCPEEIWTMIIDMVEEVDHHDVLNLFEAIPELKGAVWKERRNLWMLKDVGDNVANWLDAKDLLNFRLVSKGWRVAVDTHLEERFQRPPSAELRNDPVRTHFEGAYSFKTVAHFERFTSRERDLIHGKMIVLDRPTNRKGGDPKCQSAYWAAAFQLFRKYEAHIRRLNVRVEYRDVFSFCRCLVMALKLLPNLKCLDLSGPAMWLFGPAWKPLLKCLEDLPDLPQLETFRSSYSGLPQLGEALLAKYGSQLKHLQFSLTMGETWAWAWKDQYSNALPNLLELDIARTPRLELEIYPNRFRAKLNQILLSLKAPHLRRLQVTGNWKTKAYCVVVLDMKEFAMWLIRFPELRHLKLAQGILSIEGEVHEEDLKIYVPLITRNSLSSFR